MQNRLILIGIDGATFNVINQMIKKGKLKTIANLMNTGVSGMLRSTVPPVSPVAWTSLTTGTNPGKHQIFDFSGKQKRSYRFRANTSARRKSSPLWTYLSDAGKRVFIGGVTMTYPPDKVNGIMISGLGSPPDADLSELTYPPEFSKTIADILGCYRTVPDVEMRKLNVSPKEQLNYIQGIKAQFNDRVTLFRYLWENDTLDFSMLFFLDTDGVSHYFWHTWDPSHHRYKPDGQPSQIEEIYEAVDEAISEVLNIIKNEAVNIILVSDHGFGPMNKVLYLNNWLEKEGYLTFKHENAVRKIIRKTKAFLGKTRDSRQIHWEKTRVYFNGTAGNLFFNLTGRDPQGTVNPLEKNKLADELKTRLYQLTDPDTGAQVISHVYDREELAISDDSDTAPDLVVTFQPGYAVVGEEIALHNLIDSGQTMSMSNNWSGNHTPEGIFIASGPGFKKGTSISNAELIDIAPTVLYAMDTAIPCNMDGRVLQSAFSDNFLKHHSIEYQDKENNNLDSPLSRAAEALSDYDDEKINERLRDLGYLE